jgi:hypothetical protein
LLLLLLHEITVNEMQTLLSGLLHASASHLSLQWTLTGESPSSLIEGAA